MATKKPKAQTAPGPSPDRLKIDVDWEAAATRIVKAKPPTSGWAKPKTKKRVKK